MVSDVRAWLQDLQLAHFADAFDDNGVDMALLAELDNGDLKDMGVSRVADRKKILKAIAALGAYEPAAVPTAPSSRAQVDRRQVSVLFCDLVGSTALSTRLDPEDLREVLRRYQDTVAGVIQSCDGYVADYRGDGVLAYFGWPVAHEDQALNAVRAGLQAVAAVPAIEVAAIDALDGEVLSAKASVATGDVVVGDLPTEGGLQTGAISGETPNRAARIESESQPGQVLIDGATRRLLGAQFQTLALGRKRFKGIEGLVDVWRVTVESAGVTRFEARRDIGGLSEFVGRADESATIEAAVHGATEGVGRTICLCGEAGIGKSRLAQFAERLARKHGLGVIRYQCAPAAQYSAFYPFVQQLTHAAALVQGEPADTQLDKLEAAVRPTDRPVSETISILAALLNVSAPPRHPPLSLSPEALLRKTRETLVEQLLAQAHGQALLIVVEDLHWADTNTVEVIKDLAKACRELPVVLLTTYRPEFLAPWVEQANNALLSVERLGRSDARALIGNASRGQILPERIVEQILERADGIPLFIEELVASVLESAGAGENAGANFAASASVAIPETLQDSLIARLDRLSPVREIAQLGAVIGREFSHELLAHIAPIGGNELNDALQVLQGSGLISALAEGRSRTYQFKHALVRDAAYQSTLRARRRQLHLAVADALEHLQPDLGNTQPELLAQHLTLAVEPERAIAYWLAAAQLATTRAAYPDALEHAEAGLALVDAVKDTQVRAPLELALIVAKASAILPTNGYADPRVGEAIELIAGITSEAPDSPALIGGMFWASVSLWNAGDVQAAITYAPRLLRIAEATHDEVVQVAARGYIGSLQVHVPDFEQSRANLGFVAQHYSAQMHEPLCQMAGQDLGLNGLSWDAYRTALEGRPDTGIAMTEQVVERSRGHDHPFGHPLIVLTACWVAHLCRDQARAHLWANEVLHYCETRQVSYWHEFARLHVGYAHLLHGELAVDLETVEATLSWATMSGVRVYGGTHSAALALAYQHQGNAARSAQLFAQAKAFCAGYHDLVDVANVRQLCGESFELRGQVNEALAEYDAMYRLAQSAGARMLQLKAATARMRLAAHGPHEAALRRDLSKLYAGFDEGFDAPDLVDARSALAGMTK